MTITVHPTLDAMARIYSLPTRGGADSERFREYVELARGGHKVHEYNPMTKNPAAPETVQALLEVDAETLVRRTLTDFGGLDELEVAVVVLSPGFWTDRLFNEVRNRRDGLAAVWFWAGEPVDTDTVEATAKAEAARTLWRRHQGVTDSLRSFAAQEAVAANASGFHPTHADDKVGEVLDILGEAGDDHTLIGYLFGDEVAESADWSGVGLHGDEGPRTVARWMAEEVDWRRAVVDGWVPSLPPG